MFELEVLLAIIGKNNINSGLQFNIGPTVAAKLGRDFDVAIQLYKAGKLSIYPQRLMNQDFTLIIQCPSNEIYSNSVIVIWHFSAKFSCTNRYNHQWTISISGFSSKLSWGFRGWLLKLKLWYFSSRNQNVRWNYRPQRALVSRQLNQLVKWWLRHFN